MKQISGGVTAAKGYKAGAVSAFRVKNGNKVLDLALILSEREAAAAATYTLNQVKAAPIYETKENLKNGKARALVCNSGNANACAPNGRENARRMCESAAGALGLEPEDIIVASTGVIGRELPIEKIEGAMPGLASSISEQGGDEVAQAILTTDLSQKQIALQVEIGGTTVTLGAAAKGSGMIHPNMGTMLAFITTDCAISQLLLQKALSETVRLTYNRISVDGDTSTNDMCAILANGMAENPLVEREDEGYQTFFEALLHINRELAKSIARDGEGATKLITCTVKNADSEEEAGSIAMQVIKSSLLKAAMFGNDANWGRVICAMGYSEGSFAPEQVDIGFFSRGGTIQVCKNGVGLDFDEELALEILKQDEVFIDIDLKQGLYEATAWGCDLSYDYVRINGDYRS